MRKRQFWIMCDECKKETEIVSDSPAWHFQDHAGWCEVRITGLNEQANKHGHFETYALEGEFCSKRCALMGITKSLLKDKVEPV